MAAGRYNDLQYWGFELRDLVDVLGGKVMLGSEGSHLELEPTFPKQRRDYIV
jgi:hypothetical protein